MKNSKGKLIWDHLEEIIAALVILVMAIVNFANVIGRFVFSHALPWADELTLMLFLWATMFGGAVAFRHGSHFNMGLLAEGGGKKRRIFLAAVSMICCVAFSTLVLVLGIKMVSNEIAFKGMLTTLHISQAYQGMAIPVGAVFMIIRSVENFITAIKKEKEAERT